MSRSPRAARALALSLIAALAACAQPQPPVPPALSGPEFSAGPGEVMVITDACAFRACPPGAPPALAELVFLGMRSDREAVFERREVTAHAGPLRESGVPGVLVPDRPPTPEGPGRFIPPRAPEAGLSAAVTEIVLDPVAGAAFGVDDIAIAVTEITPGRVRYHLERL